MFMAVNRKTSKMIIHDLSSSQKKQNKRKWPPHNFLVVGLFLRKYVSILLWTKLEDLGDESDTPRRIGNEDSTF